VKKLKQVFRNLVKIILIACFVAGVLIIVFVWAFGIGVQDIYVNFCFFLGVVYCVLKCLWNSGYCCVFGLGAILDAVSFFFMLE
jgi:predicted PurR-regulated permease PerM